MTTMTEQIDFLLARIAEDEAVAREVGADGQWDAATDRWWGALSNHAARHDPARVLAECAAKRAIVEAFQKLHLETYRGTDDPATEARRHQAAVAMSHVAAIYADHEDFREEWGRP